MQQYIIPVNNEALSRAINGLYGDNAAEAVGKAYGVIDGAMQLAFEAGRLEEATKVLAERAEEAVKINADIETARQHGFMAGHAHSEDYDTKEAFSDGYDAGFADGEEFMKTHDAKRELQDSFDDGYLEGVHDARVNPEEADDYVTYLCNTDQYWPEFDGTHHDDAAWDELDEAFEMQRDAHSIWDDSGDETDPADGLPPVWTDHADDYGWPDEDTDQSEYTYVDDVDSGDEQPIAEHTF
jgi:hypothetical protein